ncbi:MAG: hypothetical protein HZA08_11685 [Nitrospirae bacterium]|nr:hypothetical protein [Nitrospirota bacterium]
MKNELDLFSKNAASAVNGFPKKNVQSESRRTFGYTKGQNFVSIAR